MGRQGGRHRRRLITAERPAPGNPSPPSPFSRRNDARRTIMRFGISIGGIILLLLILWLLFGR
jgi:hypothetical protein